MRAGSCGRARAKTAFRVSSRTTTSRTTSSGSRSTGRRITRARSSREFARELDSAWISTIHGFCLRLLRAHPFAAGLDPRFRVLDESQGRVLRSESFEDALADFCGDGNPERLRLLATYGKSGLRRMLT